MISFSRILPRLMSLAHVRTLFQELALISFSARCYGARGAKMDYRPELSADAGPGARCVSGRGLGPFCARPAATDSFTSREGGLVIRRGNSLAG